MAGHCKKHHQTVSVVLHFHLNIPLRARKMGLSRSTAREHRTQFRKLSNISREARLDVFARGFWVAGQKAFFEVWVFNPLAKRYATLDPQ